MIIKKVAFLTFWIDCLSLSGVVTHDYIPLTIMTVMVIEFGKNYKLPLRSYDEVHE